MKLTETAVAEIKASQGLYRASDVARNYGVHRSTVKRIWDGRVWNDVSPALEPPNVISKPRPKDYAEDINIMLANGMTKAEVAEKIGISLTSVYAYRGVFL